MTINGAIALTNTVVAVVLIALGLALLWQSRRSLRAWPVSALIALAGPYVAVGVVFLQTSGWRVVELPGHALDREGAGTLALRVVAVVVAAALLRRIVSGELLTPRDRDRLQGGPG